MFGKAELMSRATLGDMAGVAAGNTEGAAFSAAELFGSGKVPL